MPTDGFEQVTCDMPCGWQSFGGSLPLALELWFASASACRRGFFDPTLACEEGWAPRSASQPPTPPAMASATTPKTASQRCPVLRRRGSAGPEPPPPGPACMPPLWAPSGWSDMAFGDLLVRAESEDCRRGAT